MRGQDPGEVDQPVELGVVASCPPAHVVAVLLATPRVAAGRLEVAVRARADPHVGPRRRDGQAPDPLERVWIADEPTIGVAIGEAPPGPAARDPRSGVAGVAQPCRSRRARSSVVIGTIETPTLSFAPEGAQPAAVVIGSSARGRIISRASLCSVDDPSPASPSMVR